MRLLGAIPLFFGLLGVLFTAEIWKAVFGYDEVMKTFSDRMFSLYIAMLMCIAGIALMIVGSLILVRGL